jgi:hypothetical protein
LRLHQRHGLMTVFGLHADIATGLLIRMVTCWRCCRSACRSMSMRALSGTAGPSQRAGHPRAPSPRHPVVRLPAQARAGRPCVCSGGWWWAGSADRGASGRSTAGYGEGVGK